MSLNGLDHQKVAEAHAAASEAGAWFVLNYAARDEVELLDQGTGGLPEVRKAIENYEETSPLYGFLRYRRRVVIIRYLPEGCSRLIQARVAVHFTAVCERFSPYDSTLEITDADELSDTKLSATCSLHAASASNASSSNSSRRRRLNEIAEVDEEEQQKRASKRISLSGKADETAPPEGKRPTSPEPAVTLDSALAASPEASKFSAASTTQVPNFVGAEEAPSSVTDDGGADRRMSSQSGRPAYPHSKPKIKLAPRPSFDLNNRPQTAGNFRPVSSIPAGLKLFGNKSSSSSTNTATSAKKSKTESASSTTEASTSAFGSFHNIPEEPTGSTRQLVDAARPATSSGASLAPKSPGAMSTATVKAGMTPEKARLMKAMKMREKKMKKAKEQPPVPVLPGGGEGAENAGSPVEPVEAQVEEVKTEEPASATETTTTSTIANTDEASVLTSSSRPVSPIVASSDADESTKASSISESTDETVGAKTGENVADQEQASEEQSQGAVVERTAPEAEAEPETTQGVPLLKLDTNATEESTDGDIRGESSVEALPSCWSPFKSSFQFADHDQLTPEALVETKWVADVARAQAAEAKTEVKEDLNGENADAKAEEAARVKEANQETLAKLSSKFSSQNLNKSETEVVSEPVEEEESAEIVIMNMADEPSSTKPAAKLSSKFSSQKNLSAVQSTPENIAQSIEEPETLKPEAKESDDHSEAETIQAENKPDLKINVEPIRASMDSHTRTETDFDNDEALLDELQGATVQEARPMTVQTPLTPGFSSPLNGASPSPAVGRDSPAKPRSRGSHMVRTVSNPVRGNLMLPPTDVSQSSARSMSGGAAYLHKITQQQQAGANLANKKTNMGSGISQRIKALEMLSVEPKETLSFGSGGAGARPSSAFFSVKKGRTPSRSPSVMERATSFGRNDAASSAASTREVSPDNTSNPQARPQRERSTSVASRLSMFETSHAPGTANHSPSRLANSPRGRTESVSVTARIVRDPDTVLKAPEDPSQFSHLDLKQSAITVDHRRASPPQSGPVEAMATLTAGHMPRHERTISRDSILSDDNKGESKASRRSSLSVVKDFIKERRRSVTSNDGRKSPTKSPTLPPLSHTNTGISSRLSFTSVRTSLSKDREMGVTSPTLPNDEDDNRSITSEKRQSRAGRFMSRLSNLGSRGKLTPSSSNQLATTVTEEEITTTQPTPQRPATTATSAAPAIVSYLGDVNVQFPDNLLWKRRNLSLDAAGYILLSASAATASTVASKAAGLKRYHLGEFRRPVVPDVEVQELPNSVVLDFMSGGGLQFACEDRAGQMGVLKVLSEAHAKHALMF